ncbi:uncharacterized protein LOC113239586 [Hyposmocoma kahamanoa]|uniref:uncharacterized protein LOC113239586 n=1 Tax=Hyposmocoma kahamanoa TaxID=1477025 RepID=UPI000E6D6DC6|nr:uncharacterized protein LOC113239586 [Hyposmocoma kahamanoa]
MWTPMGRAVPVGGARAGLSFEKACGRVPALPENPSPCPRTRAAPRILGGGKLRSQGTVPISEGFGPQPTTTGIHNGSDSASRMDKEGSSDYSDVELVEPARHSSAVSLKFRKGRKRSRDKIDGSDDIRQQTAKRGRSRAISSKISKRGQTSASALLRRAEDEVADLTASTEATRSALLADRVTVEDGATTAILSKQVLNFVASIEKVSARSKNLKGEFKRALNVAAVAIKEATEALAKRSISAETRKLQADNDRLQTELNELRKEVTELRASIISTSKNQGMAPVRAHATLAPGVQRPDLDEMESLFMRCAGAMIDARFEGIEDRLLPPVRVRPPLAADRRQQVQTPQVPEAAAASYSAATQKGLNAPSSQMVRAKAGKKKKKRKKATPALSTPGEAPRPEVAPKDGWTVVGGKRAQKAKGNAPARQGQPAKGPIQPSKPKLRPPRSAAVVLTLQPEADKELTYGAAIARAKASIDLSVLGIQAVRFRRAATGATMVEVPGADSGGKADSLAAKLKELFKEEDIRVSRPVKCTELRLTGLDDSITADEIATAISRTGGCPVNQIRIGPIRWDRSGLGAVVVRCPVTAANKVVSGLKVGWAMVRVKLLPQREMRCYRCLELGHVRERCTAINDRSTLCYRCGQSGHKAAACSAEPHCALCADAGRQAKHRLGSRQCNPPVSKRDRGPPAAGTRAQPRYVRPHLSAEVVEMATD